MHDAAPARAGIFHIRRGAAEEPLRRLPRLAAVEAPPPLLEPVAAEVDQRTAACSARHPCPAVRLGSAAPHGAPRLAGRSAARGDCAATVLSPSACLASFYKDTGVLRGFQNVLQPCCGERVSSSS